MVAIARIGDTAVGICTYVTPHPIICTLIAGSPLTTADGLSMARIGDIYSTSCPSHNPIAVSVSGSGLTTDSGLGVSRIGDLATHAYGTAALIQGSPITASD